MSEKIEIYVQLLDEGVETYRPTSAIKLADGNYELLPTTDYDPEDEVWEFKPGSIVKGMLKKLSGGEVLVAV